MQEDVFYSPSIVLPVKSAKMLEESVGCLCELRDLDSNSLVSIARIADFADDVLIVRSASGGNLYSTIFHTLYKLVIHHSGGRVSSWRGRICGCTMQKWLFDQLFCFHQMEQRKNFRQPANLAAQMLYEDDLFLPRDCWLTAAHPCRVIDVSLGGFQVAGNLTVAAGDRIRVLNLFLPGFNHPFFFDAHICWIKPAESKKVRCGCAFQRISTQEEDCLCAAILRLQRDDIAEQKI